MLSAASTLGRCRYFYGLRMRSLGGRSKGHAALRRKCRSVATRSSEAAEADRIAREEAANCGGFLK
jgi:hypothetical protein